MTMIQTLLLIAVAVLAAFLLIRFFVARRSAAERADREAREQATREAERQAAEQAARQARLGAFDRDQSQRIERRDDHSLDQPVLANQVDHLRFEAGAANGRAFKFDVDE